MIFLSSPVDTTSTDSSVESVEGDETFAVDDDPQAQPPPHHDSPAQPLPLPRVGR